jgi:hypothetical protein
MHREPAASSAFDLVSGRSASGSMAWSGRGVRPRHEEPDFDSGSPLRREAPVAGWRVWRLGVERLRSWVLDADWQPGANEARCLDRHAAILRRPPCEVSPGKGCWCGFWALWDITTCLAKARGEGAAVGSPAVVGLISGWGTVAIHGNEGFRAQYASVSCLLSDSVWAESLDPLCGRPVRLTRFARRLGLMAPTPHPLKALERAAATYQVPLLSLATAVRGGVLGELGVPAEQVLRVRAVLDDASTASAP